MNRIRLLPEHVANQIAAGEVVERPASVVKELVENSLDAGASRVVVEIQGGGRSLVRVTDDGVGMSRDDALLCLERHATSKIQRAEDLAAIATMGFRGEALPSIASVSRFLLTTRERDTESPEGTRIIISAGKMLEVQAAGSAPGTSIEVRHLFFNLPARRKFLRTEPTETAHIQHYLSLAALAYPHVALTFIKDGRTVWQLPAARGGNDPATRLEALRERLRALYGSDLKLLAVNFQGELRPVQAEEEFAPGAPAANTTLRVWGFIGAPGVARPTREDQHLFVNRRPIENRGLNFALLEGYHTSLMKGRYPVACLFLELDPGAVDVNIHPAKREVRFHQEFEVRRLVGQAVREALLEFHAAGDSAGVAPGSAPRPAPQPARPPAPAWPPAAPARGGDSACLVPQPDAAPQPQPALGLGSVGGASVGEPPRSQPVPPTAASPAAPPPPSVPPASGPVPLLRVPLRLVGVVGRLYVVLESDRGLVLLDQHAAHERILFEQMLSRLETQAQAPSQKLLLPETIELSARDASFVREQLPVLSRLGVSLSEFGERTFLLDGLPPFVRAADPRRFVVELVDELKAAGEEINTLRLGEHVVAKTVCRHAVKANDPLSGPELEALVQDLRHCAMPYTCPHGRPTLVEMNFRELEKKFGRSQ